MGFGLRFFYHVTQHRPEIAFEIPRPRQPQKLPEILSREEVARLFDVTPNVKHRTLLMTAYAAGLRVEQGKGAKDRYTLLSPCLLDQLRVYWRGSHPRHWLFPMARSERPINPSQAQKMYYAAKARAGITKTGGIHALRHGNLSTTARYFHLAQGGLGAIAKTKDLLQRS